MVRVPEEPALYMARPLSAGQTGHRPPRLPALPSVRAGIILPTLSVCRQLTLRPRNCEFCLLACLLRSDAHCADCVSRGTTCIDRRSRSSYIIDPSPRKRNRSYFRIYRRPPASIVPRKAPAADTAQDKQGRDGAQTELGKRSALQHPSGLPFRPVSGLSATDLVFDKSTDRFCG